jgi:hypothetical protein
MPATIGKTDIGGTGPVSTAVNMIRVTRFSSSAGLGELVQTFSWYTRFVANADFRALIYDDDGAGEPDNLLMEIELSGTTEGSPVWHDWDVSSEGVIIPASPEFIFLGIHTPGTSNTINYDSVGQTDGQTVAYASGAPDPWGTSTVDQTRELSYHVDTITAPGAAQQIRHRKLRGAW